MRAVEKLDTSLTVTGGGRISQCGRSLWLTSIKAYVQYIVSQNFARTHAINAWGILLNFDTFDFDSILK